MTKLMTKSMRRYHRWCKIQNAMNHLSYLACFDTYAQSIDKNSIRVKKIRSQAAITPVRCSCWMCGNPRKYYKNSRSAKSLQELRAANDEYLGLLEWHDDHAA